MVTASLLALALVIPCLSCGQECDGLEPGLLQLKLETESTEQIGSDPEEDIVQDLEILEPYAEEFFGPHADIALALPLVLQNITNYSGLVGAQGLLHPNVSHVFGQEGPDEDLLFEMVDGFWTILEKHLPSLDMQTFCPRNDVRVIRRCIDMAACALQNDVSQNTTFSIEIFTLYEELLGRFDDLGWEEIEEALMKENGHTINDTYLVPQDYACDTSYDWYFENIPDTGPDLLQTNSSRAKVAAALQTSVAVQQAQVATHAIMDAHMLNSSVEATVHQLHAAWKPACDLLQCDHTNYYDFYGASHMHSVALMEAGASAQHMRLHIRNRIKLEHRVQKFLAQHGSQFMTKIYRAEGTETEAQITSYLAKGRAEMQRYLSKYIKSQDDVQTILPMLSRDKLKAWLQSHGEDHALEVIFGSPELGLLEVDEGMDVDEGIFGRRRRRRRRRRIWSAVSNAVSSAANAVGSVVTAVANFVADLFACFGQTKTMVKTGYCKKISSDQVTGAGFGVGVGTSGGNLLSLLQGTVQPNMGVTLGVVIGAVPFDPVVGGARTGVGIGGGVSCSASSCSVGISVGYVASALIPTNDPNCVFGTFLGDFRCMVGAGVAISAFCCSFDLTNGANSCR